MYTLWTMNAEVGRHKGRRASAGLPGALLLSCLLVLGGCSALSGIPDEQPPDTLSQEPDYRIGVSDTLNIHVWRNPDLSLTTRVRPDGYISMPLLTDLKADGRLPRELAQEITEALSTVIRNPEVTVIVTDTASNEYRNRVRVTGQVLDPISIPYRPGMTVLDVVIHAGGLTEFAAGQRAVLQRSVNGEYQPFDIDLVAILQKGDLRTNYALNPGDVISVPHRQLWRGEL